MCIRDRPSTVIVAVKWALARVDFEALLLTDDRSIVHVGRVWEWVISRPVEANSRMLAWRRTGDEATSTSVTTDLLVERSGSWLAGRGVCRQLMSASRKSRERLGAEHVYVPPGFVRYKPGVARGATIVDGIRHRPHEAFRQLLQAPGFPAVWQNPRAFEREECAGCEARFFAREGA